MPRRQLEGADAIAEALDQGEPVCVLLLARDSPPAAAQALARRAEAMGVHIWRGGEGDLRRMARSGTPPDAIAMIGPDPAVSLGVLMARGGAVWLLDRASYPSNVGFAIRTAEVSGAEGIVVDADFNHEQRSRASHVSMGADRVMPVLYDRTTDALDAARTAGRRIIALEDSGEQAPWEVDLGGAIVLLVGNERRGLSDAALSRCDARIRIPMPGFVPSYNLQAALSAVAAERLRQTSR